MRLTHKDRKLFADMYQKEHSVMEIAVKLKIHPCTVYDELKRGDTGEVDEIGRRVYDPDLAQRKINENLRRVGKKHVEIKEGKICPAKD